MNFLNYYPCVHSYGITKAYPGSDFTLVTAEYEMKID